MMAFKPVLYDCLTLTGSSLATIILGGVSLSPKSLSSATQWNVSYLL